MKTRILSTVKDTDMRITNSLLGDTICPAILSYKIQRNRSSYDERKLNGLAKREERESGRVRELRERESRKRPFPRCMIAS